MLLLLSPSKTIAFDDAPAAANGTQPVFLPKAETLMRKLKSLSTQRIAQLMSLNAALAEQATERINTWEAPFHSENAKPAILCFKGAVYTGLDAHEWSESDFEFAQKHLRILSGLYGILKPLDLMQPYRLEMGLRWAVTPSHKNLYSFWGDHIHKTVEGEANGLIINLASKEYSKSAIHPHYTGTVITPEFKERVGDGYKARMAYAKEARGAMAKFIIQNRIFKTEQIQTFTGMGYAFHPGLSSENQWVFTRETPSPES